MNLEELKDYIKKNYVPEDAGSGYWDTGNYDDAFAMGQDVGKRDTLFDIGIALGMDLQDPDEIEFD